MQAEVDDQNAQLALVYEELDGLLDATLRVDDFVDLDSLKIKVEHPEFDRIDLNVPTPPPAVIPDLDEPQRWTVAPAKGLFGRQKRTEEAQAQAEAEFLKMHEAWWHANQALPGQRAAAAEKHSAVENARLEALALEESRYASECEKREQEAVKHNKRVDDLIANLGYGAADAVAEYVGIVLANSVYPEHFDVRHDAEFTPTGAELRVRVTLPDPSQIPTIKSFKYVKATDQISSTEQSQRDTKARYANIVDQVALRTMHEIFEADRRNIIRAISLEVGSETNNPATGKLGFIPFAALAASREKFADIELSGIVPAATLAHLGASVSKNPYDLVPANGTGVRRA
ncbi:MAG: hypothetical protein JWR57_1017 [Mycetocola sp.]|nr:hypothetical protein [Mycetocola sp.]